MLLLQCFISQKILSKIKDYFLKILKNSNKSFAKECDEILHTFIDSWILIWKKLREMWIMYISYIIHISLNLQYEHLNWIVKVILRCYWQNVIDKLCFVHGFAWAASKQTWYKWLSDRIVVNQLCKILPSCITSILFKEQRQSINRSIWLHVTGNAYIHELTTDLGQNHLQIEIVTTTNEKITTDYAFHIDDVNNEYRLHVSDFVGLQGLLVICLCQIPQCISWRFFHCIIYQKSLV